MLNTTILVKLQITNTKLQINPNIQAPNYKYLSNYNIQ